MNHDDIPAGLRLCRLAGWNQVAADWRFFLASNPDGCRVAVDDAGEVIGTVATIAYGSAFSWIGMVLVDPEYRRAGIGTRLLHEALALLGDATTARLDATPAGRTVYAALEFEDEYELQRMVRPANDGLNSGRVHPSAAAGGMPASFGETRRSLGEGEHVDRVRQMSDADFDDILTFDREVFGADRRALLERHRTEAREYTWVVGDSHIEGYLFGRHGHAFEHLGPLVTHDEETARRLVSACMSAHLERPFVIDIPRRASWISWLESEGFRLQRPFMRMRRGQQRYRDRVDRLFAIAGPEFG